MKNVHFILVSNTSSQGVARAVAGCYLPRIKQHVVVRAHGLQREALLERLCRLRDCYPEAKILGVEELGKHQVQAQAEMNELRRSLAQ